MGAGNTVMGKMFILAGVMLIILGGLLLLSHRFPQVGLGRLPGDIRIERENVTFYFPLGTCILLSAIVTALWKAVSYLRR